MEIDNNPSEETKNRWHNDPNNWIWGIFYYNPEDKRIFPPKKIKELGWTINFANPNSLFIVFIIIASAFIFGKLLK
ncbi:DUF5808 domain-containing protein [Flavobacterium sp. MC2016-06]|jgi:uncharacterized membrane protein|uniref:DUF5808 domain-containing protein n=1 Tax=Flavobacterium sp. MC2016-06 TaxID=2676308 RepID=UPI0012BB08CE|nr:DUF5808 domain-containing protein [Flavobacterium sp. MC2016-06]MBU3861049.1 hypothetical protein [Flavobacterium sp. MC2016-06]